MNHIAYLLLGSNVGDRIQWLDFGVRELKKNGVLQAESACYQTVAWGMNDQPDFLNKAVCLETSIDKYDLLQQTQRIEQEAGRQRDIHWGPRTLDIDLLFFDDDVEESPHLRLPHPLLSVRKFALLPLNEIASEFVHPVLKKTVYQLLRDCPDSLMVKRVIPQL